MTGLPQGWTETALGDVCELLNGRAYSQPELLSEGKYPVLRVGNLFSRNAWYHSDLELDPDKYIDSGDLIYAWSASFGPRIWQGGKVIYHYHIWKCALQNQAVDKQFLYNLLLWDTAKIKGDHGVGSTMMHVTKSAMEKRQIPLPPLPEQRRIVRKLDTLTARSTTARTHLTTIEKLVERFKRAVLGQFFPDDRPTKPLGVSCTKIGSGATPRGGKNVYLPEGTPLIRSQNVRFEGFDWDGLAFISDEHADELRNVTVRTGDVLLNITGASIGRVCLTPEAMDGARVNQHVSIIRPIPQELDAGFVQHFLSSPSIQNWIWNENYGVTRQALTKGMIEEIAIPDVSLEEQREIVHRIETAFAKIGRLAAEAAKALKLLGHLDQRILAKAFAGDLVPQDPNDEPAETLLARIREARAAAPKGRKRRSA